MYENCFNLPSNSFHKMLKGTLLHRHGALNYNHKMRMSSLKTYILLFSAEKAKTFDCTCHISIFLTLS